MTNAVSVIVKHWPRFHSKYCFKCRTTTNGYVSDEGSNTSSAFLLASVLSRQLTLWRDVARAAPVADEAIEEPKDSWLAVRDRFRRAAEVARPIMADVEAEVLAETSNALIG